MSNLSLSICCQRQSIITSKLTLVHNGVHFGTRSLFLDSLDKMQNYICIHVLEIPSLKNPVYEKTGVKNTYCTFKHTIIKEELHPKSQLTMFCLEKPPNVCQAYFLFDQNNILHV